MDNLERRFWRHARVGDGCWEWHSSTYRERWGQPYGAFFLMRQADRNRTKEPRSAIAHRVSWALANGPIPDLLFVCHRCDNRLCVRPSHLFLGTHADNMADMVRKNRASRHSKGTARGSRLGAKIDAEIVHRKKNGETLRALAVEFGFASSTIHRIATKTRVEESFV